MARMLKRFAQMEDDLHESAMLDTGLTDFGDPTYREAMRVVLHALDTDVRLTVTGWQSVCYSLVQLLRARLYAQKGWKEQPKVLESPIRRPLVITGLARSGTTALHRLLCVDPQFQGVEFWLRQRPMSRPPRESWASHPAYQACIADIEARYAHAPGLLKAHELSPGEVEDCARLLMPSFMRRAWEGSRLPTYDRWLQSQSTLPSYRRYADVLRLIGSNDPHRRWLLKSPSHLCDIDTLLEVFPDAGIIHTHRDPLEAIPSFCNMQYMVAQSWEGDAARPEIIGPRQCAHWHRGLERAQAARSRDPVRFCDVDHRRFLVDPMGVVRSIYDHFGLSMTSATELQMRAWVAASPTSRHGKHVYSSEAWGVSLDEIRAIFSAYRTRYGFTA